MDRSTLYSFWTGVGWPLCRLLLSVALGLLAANFIETLNWTHRLARVARPLIRRAHLPDTVAVSFSMAFFSGVAANTMLSEAYAAGRINRRELVLANLCASMPTYFLHLPTLFFIALPLLKSVAFTYVGLTLAAAMVRTWIILVLGRLLLPGQQSDAPEEGNLPDTVTAREAMAKAWARFQRRFRKIVLSLVPIYCLMFVLNRGGAFHWLEGVMATHLAGISWLRPESIGIIVFHLAAELAAGLAAAGALIDAGSLPERDVILALLAGNVLSTPMRAIRHQFPYYAGIFPPRLAVELLACGQLFRAASLILVGIVYAGYTG